MASNNPLLKPEIGPDGLAREASVIGYTERVLFLPILSFIFLFFNLSLLSFSSYFVADHRRGATSIAQVTSLH
jgi:hypothetical protein